jgi:hypothetical protein
MSGWTDSTQQDRKVQDEIHLESLMDMRWDILDRISCKASFQPQNCEVGTLDELWDASWSELEQFLARVATWPYIEIVAHIDRIEVIENQAEIALSSYPIHIFYRNRRA